jgi:prefoldin subunit 5
MAENEHRTIDPNSDDVEALSKLPGVGPVMAQRIIDARPFDRPEELTRVRGIGPSTLARLQSRLSLASTDQGEVGLGEQDEGTERVEAKAPEVTAPYEVPPSSEKAAHEPIEAGEEEGKPQASPAMPEAVSAPEMPSEPLPEAAAEPEAPPQGPALEVARPAEDAAVWSASGAFQPARRSRVWWAAATVGFVVLVLSLVLSLAILASINGGQLQFASPGDLAAMGVRVDGLEARAGELSQELQGLRTRLDNVEAFGGRIDTLEGTAQGFRADLDDATAQVGSLSGELDSLDSQIAGLGQDLADFQTAVTALESDVQALQDQNARTQTFLAGLRDLLDELFAQEGGAQ